MAYANAPHLIHSRIHLIRNYERVFFVFRTKLKFIHERHESKNDFSYFLIRLRDLRLLLFWHEQSRRERNSFIFRSLICSLTTKRHIFFPAFDWIAFRCLRSKQLVATVAFVGRFELPVCWLWCLHLCVRRNCWLTTDWKSKKKSIENSFVVN